MRALRGLRCHVFGGYPPRRVGLHEMPGPPSLTTTASCASSHARSDRVASAQGGGIASSCRLPAIADGPPFRLHSARARPRPPTARRPRAKIKDDSVNHPSLYGDRLPRWRRRARSNRSRSSAARRRAISATCLGARRASGSRSRVHSARSRTGEGARLRGLQTAIVAVRGNYDDVNRLRAQVADRWLGLRQHQPSRTTPKARRRWDGNGAAGWRFPQHIVSPVAGGTLLPRIFRGLRELKEIGLVAGDLPKIHAAQAAGCAPVVNALDQGLEFPDPVRPSTIAKSIAIGNPADGFQVVRTVRDTGGTGVASTDDEILTAIDVLAETEGIFTERGRWPARCR